jgi:tetratricopeptide repeat protein
MYAQIQVSVPAQVEVGENFRLAYTINTQDIEDFRVGNIPSNLEVLAGPYTSRQSSYQMINGHTSSSSSITFTYTLNAVSNGIYTIPAARVRINGKTVLSKIAKIKVIGSTRSGSKASRMNQYNDDGSSSQAQSSSTNITGNDLFIRVSANKRRVYEQEPVLLTYKVYTQVELTQLEGKMPDLTGFHTQEIPLPQQKSFHLERVNGKPYKVVTWSQYVMFPQVTGELSIPSITFKGTVVRQNRSVDPFEAFFNGGSGYVEVKKNIEAPGLTIQVDALPKKPVNFSGGVGNFNITASLNKLEVKAGEPLSLRVVVSGKGNLKLIKQPEINLPKDFDKYDPKVKDNTKLTSSGVEGNKEYTFLVVPRNQGTFTIPSIEFTYYDTSLNSYKTVKTQVFSVTVFPGDKLKEPSLYDAEKENDIHDIIRDVKTGNTENGTFFGSPIYWISLVSLFLSFIFLLIVFRQRALERSNIVGMRGKKANIIAQKRLKNAKRLMAEGLQNEFYDEVLRALWDYVGYKLNIPTEALSRDNIAENLRSNYVDNETVNKFLLALDECEFKRYAPGDPSGNMNSTFEMAFIAISNIEQVMNKVTKR